MSNNGLYYDEKPPAPPIRFSSSSTSSSSTIITSNNGNQQQQFSLKNINNGTKLNNNGRIYCSGQKTGLTFKQQLSKPLPHEPDYSTNNNGFGSQNGAGGFGSNTALTKKQLKKSKMVFGKSWFYFDKFFVV